MDLESDDAGVISPKSPLYHYLCQAGFEHASLDDGDTQTYPVSKPKSTLQLPLFFSGVATTTATLWNSAQHWARRAWDAVPGVLYEIDSKEFLQAILCSPVLLEHDHHFLEELVDLRTLSSINQSATADSLMCIVFSALVLMISRWFVEASWNVLVYVAGVAASVSVLWLALTQLKRSLLQQQQLSLCDLLEAMKDFRSNVKKCIQAIQESEVVARGFTLASHNVPVQWIEMNKLIPSLDPKRQCPELRRYVFLCTREMFLFWRSMTCNLIESVPLPEEVDACVVHLARTAPEELSKELFAAEEEELYLGTEFYSIAALKSMLYLLDHQQSEFLQRLALCMLPSIVKGGQYSCREVRRVINQAKVMCTGNIRKISNAYQFSRMYQFTQGVTSSSPPTSRTSLPAQELHLAVRSVALHLQAALKRAQAMENITESFTEEIMGDDLRSRMGCLVAETQAELASGITCLEEISGFMEKKTRSEGVADENTVEQTMATAAAASDTRPVMTITDEDNPVIVDEVFEALLNDKSEPQGSDTDGDYDYDIAAVSKESRAKQKEASATVLKELRTVLVLKAKEHQEREKNALARSGLEGEHFDKLGFVIPECEDETQTLGVADDWLGVDGPKNKSCPSCPADAQTPTNVAHSYRMEDERKTEEHFPTIKGVDHFLSGDQCRNIGQSIRGGVPEQFLFPDPKSIAHMAVGKSKLFSPLQVSTFEDCIVGSSSDEEEEAERK